MLVNNEPIQQEQQTTMQLVESFDLATDLVSFLDQQFVEQEAHIAYADVLEQYLGERFLMGKVWVMNFTADELPYAIIVHEHIQFTWLFTLELTPAAESYEVTAQLLGKERKILMEELALMIERYIQKHKLQFADTDSIRALNDLLAHPFY